MCFDCMSVARNVIVISFPTLKRRISKDNSIFENESFMMDINRFDAFKKSYSSTLRIKRRSIRSSSIEISHPIVSKRINQDTSSLVSKPCCAEHMSRSNSISSNNSSKCSSKQITSNMQGSEILQRIFNADCDPKDLDLRQLRKSFVELLEQHRKLQKEKNDLAKEKLELVYTINYLHDQLIDSEEDINELTRKQKEKQKEFDVANRKCKEMEDSQKQAEELLLHRDQLLTAAGLVLYADPSKCKEFEGKVSSNIPEYILSKSTHEYLSKMGEETIDCKIKQLFEQNDFLQKSVGDLTDQLNNLKLKERESYANGRDKIHGADEDVNTQKLPYTIREINDLKMKLDRQNAEIACLKAEKLRMENGLNRHKEIISDLEKNEVDQTEEKRKLKRELREARQAFEELTHSNDLLRKTTRYLTHCVIFYSVMPDFVV
ncbi:hypothetical protein GJ496_004490 [Pomphorhynchus laevis]|nr:hypothetical protein GJ496_004490 [Pomphorhynchus laevis]